MPPETISVDLTAQQIDLLRGILFEYYAHHNAHDDAEEQIRLELEIILADAENELYVES